MDEKWIPAMPVPGWKSCSCKAYVFSGRPCKHLIEVARREAVHGKEKEVPAPTRSLAIARGRAASSAACAG